MNIEIIYSDKDIIVVNKPPGVVIHGGFSVVGPTLVDFLMERFPEIKSVGEDPLRPGVVHRLDKDTSGVVMAARNQKSFTALKALFQKRLVEKVYHALVCGQLQKRLGTISLAIGRLTKNPLKRGVPLGRSRVRAVRDSVTEYRVLKEAKGYSLLEVRPKSGRMHQIRVHLRAIGHPVACDRVYGGKNVCCPEGVKHQLLHAKSLSFSFPEGRRLHFEADEPNDFQSAIQLIFT